MALTKITRLRAPLDGTTFATTGNLNSLLRVITRYADESSTWPKLCNEITVPIYVRMAKYKAQITRATPDGMIYGPLVRIGTLESPEIEMFGHHWNAGLTQDYDLDGADMVDKWLYFPLPGWELVSQDASYYLCDKCHKKLHRDDDGRRPNGSACLKDGELVCRDCDVTGLVYDHETEAQLTRARKLAAYVGDKCLADLERRIADLDRGFSFGRPSQTRLFREDQYSFNWSCVIFGEDGTRKRGMNGGLIQWGPYPTEIENDRYEFRTWDYTLKAERNATHDEIKGINWSIHT